MPRLTKRQIAARLLASGCSPKKRRACKRNGFKKKNLMPKLIPFAMNKDGLVTREIK